MEASYAERLSATRGANVEKRCCIAQIAQTKQTVTDAKLQGMVADLGTQAGASELFEQVPDVNILVNNLGIYGSQAFADISNGEGIQLRFEFRFQPELESTFH